MDKSSKNIKVLYLSAKPPYPKVDGGTVAQYTLCKNIVSANSDIHIITFSTFKHPFPDFFPEKWKMENVSINTSIKTKEAFKNLMSKTSYILERYKSDTRIFMLKELAKTEKFDIIQIDHIYAGADIDIIKNIFDCPIVVRTHNVEHKIWEEKAQNEKNIAKKKYLQVQAKRLKNEELNILKKANSVLCISEDDQAVFKKLIPEQKFIYFPVGLEIEQNAVDKNMDLNKAYFIGAFDWEPNVEGLMSFIEKNWESVLEKHPDFKLHVAGRKMPESLINTSIKNIIFEGEVKSVDNFLADKSIFIAPIKSGGGVKIKVLEAMSKGKLVIASPQAVRGINIKKDVHYLDMGENFENFTQVLSKLNQNIAFEISNNAKIFASENYSMKKTSEMLLKTYQKLIDEQKR